MTYSTPDWAALQRAVSGDVILPESPGYETARKPAIPRFDDVRPRAVVQCKSAGDVAETIAFARRAGLPAVPRSGGHCFAGRSSTTDIVIDVTPLSSVSVSNGVATIGAGARLGEVYDALQEHGLTIPAGCGPTVGIAGLTLGGGLGILGRKHGLTSDHLLGAQVVLADGSIIECDEHDHEDLFWALRGAGGGNFGVVTSLTFRTLPAPDATAFHMIWPHAHATALIVAWQVWAPVAPDEIAASLLLTASGNSDRAPGVHLFGAMLGAESDARDLIAEFVDRADADPESEFYSQMPYREVKRYLAEHGPSEAEGEQLAEGHSYSKSDFFRRTLPNDAIQALVDHFVNPDAPGLFRVLDFSPWGGAYNRVPHDATAFVHRNELFLLKQEVIVPATASSDEREAARHWLEYSWETVHPWGTGGVYPNFPDPDLDDWAHAYYGTNLDRLMRVKERYDPDNAFNFQQSLPKPYALAWNRGRSPSSQ